MSPQPGDTVVATLNGKVRLLRYLPSDNGLPWVMDQTYDRADYVQSNWDLGDARLQGVTPVKPHRPAEPTGFGAVVTAGCQCNAEPHIFVYEPQSDRFESRPLNGFKPWKSSCGHHVYEDLHTVEILSHGVKA